jgi:CRISPR-associated protein Csm2
MANKPSGADLRSIVVEGDSKKLVGWAETIGKGLASGVLTTSQIRNVFGVVRQIEMQGYGDLTQQRKLLLLKPKLAYARGRESNQRKQRVLQDLEEVLSPAIDLVENEQHFRNFFDFFEAILAYHRAAGGRE